jgi:hypothetical protein
MSLIISCAHIKHNQVSVNGETVFTADENLLLPPFLTELYKTLGINYPKFHKMDLLCKLGFLCTELALKNTNFLSETNLLNAAIILSNASSSFETDTVYQNSINDKLNYFPSPTVFVYTLPNIIIGELAIKHKITGENAFFVSRQFDADLLLSYINCLFAENTTSAISGWVDVNELNYEAFIFLVQKDTNKSAIFKPLNQANLLTLYNQTKWTH